MESIDDLFDDEFEDVYQQEGLTTEPPGHGSIEEPDTEEEDVIVTLLKRLGIVDPNKIKFEDEDGEVLERAWDDLSYEELLNILTTSDETSTEESDNDLDDNEIDLINSVRLANITPLEYIEQVKQRAIEEYLSTNNIAEPTYTIDEYTDDELFIYDMQARMPDLTDEEVTLALESAKANEVVFKKQINGLRTEYKKLEEDKIQQDRLMAQQQLQEEYTKYANVVWEEINNLDEIAGTFVLEDEDKQMLAQFILGQDQAGLSYLNKALSDPLTLIEMSWFALKGREAIDSINDYYKELITKARKSGYTKGLEDSKKSNPDSSKVVAKTLKSKLVKREYKTIDDLDFD